MSCAEHLRTQAFLDGAVDGAEAEAIERHIEGCADCQAFCADAAAISDGVRTLLPRQAAPGRLRRRVSAAIEAERRAAPPARRPFGVPGFWRGAASGAGVTAVAAGLALFALMPPSSGTLADQLAGAHVSALMQGRTIEVVSSDHHTVKPWFAGRAPLSPPVADFAAEGFPLAGGRLDRIGAARAAVVVYRHGRHEIDLYAWPDRGQELPDEAIRRGYRLIFWKRGDLDFAAVSDAAEPELRQFVALVRSEPE